MEAKRGLRNPLDEAQVRKAVAALQYFLEKNKGDSTKKQLVTQTEYISCIITRKAIPSKGSLKPIQIDIPHSLWGGENDAEMCLFVKDTDKDRIKKALAEDPVPGLSKVMSVKKLRKNFSQFDDKRTLAGAYDMFLADDRILPYLKTPLGTKFFVKKKQPVAVRVSRKDVSNAIRAVFHRTTMHTSTGPCTNVRVAHFGMSVDEIVENIVVAMNNCAAHVIKGWHGVQSISIKTADSLALPIYNALSDVAKLPPVANKKTLLKRKLEEVEAETPAAKEAETPKQTPAKKQKKAASTPVKKEAETPAKKAKKETPVKKAETPAKKTETPVKKAETPAKKQKKETPVKKTETPEPAAKKQKKETPVKQQQKTPESTPAKQQQKKAKTPTPSKKAGKKQ
ncbi:hypothetical protein ATCC90586_003188 [Pythium insidiosum]|nr:hypothetical protein ATCC90586_003188 [Pythium insidiosum]